MKSGDTLLIDEPGTSYDSHLWIVISDMDEDPHFALIVNMTTWRDDKDQACILDVGDHPYVKHKTCINYAKAKHLPAVPLDDWIATGKIKNLEPVSDALLKRIRDSAENSKGMEIGIWQVLENQNLVS